MLSRKAALVLGASTTFTVAAVAFQAYAAAALGVAWFLLFAVNSFYVLPPRLEASLAPGADEVSEDQRVQLGVEMENVSARPAVVEPRLALPSTFSVELEETRPTPLSGHERISWDAVFRPRLLGGYEVGPLRVRIRDPSGFRALDHEVGAARRILVRPRREELKSVPLELGEKVRFFGVHETRQPGDGFEFYTLRQWEHGDSIRSVNWRATARAGELIVNQRTRESYVAVAILVDASAYAFQGRLVRSPYAESARAVASLVDYLLDDRDEVQFHLLADEIHTIHPQAAERQARQILELLAGTKPAGRFRWDEVLEEVLPTLNPAQPVVFASPFETDPTIVPVVRNLAAREHQIVALSAPTSWPDGQADDTGHEIRRRHRAMARDEIRRVGGTFVDLGDERPLSEAFLEAAIL